MPEEWPSGRSDEVHKALNDLREITGALGSMKASHTSDTLLLVERLETTVASLSPALHESSLPLAMQSEARQPLRLSHPPIPVRTPTPHRGTHTTRRAYGSPRVPRSMQCHAKTGSENCLTLRWSNP